MGLSIIYPCVFMVLRFRQCFVYCRHTWAIYIESEWLTTEWISAPDKWRPVIGELFTMALFTNRECMSRRHGWRGEFTLPAMLPTPHQRAVNKPKQTPTYPRCETPLWRSCVLSAAFWDSVIFQGIFAKIWHISVNFLAEFSPLFCTSSREESTTHNKQNIQTEMSRAHAQT